MQLGQLSIQMHHSITWYPCLNLARRTRFTPHQHKFSSGLITITYNKRPVLDVLSGGRGYHFMVDLNVLHLLNELQTFILQTQYR